MSFAIAILSAAGRIAGRVVQDGDRTPAPGAMVILLLPPPKGQDAYYGKLPLRPATTDAGGNFWFYGGYDGNTFDDLWEYSPTSGLWTWVAGSKTTNTLVDWGTQGVAAANNQPGGRFASISWVDSAGHLWLLGGEVSAAVGNYAPFPDLWEYTP